MAHNQEMLVKNKEAWGGNVRIIGLSIDQDADKLKSHVEAKEWTAVEHYWSRNGKNDAPTLYGVQGVPHCLLVDTHGKIVFIGHPASRKLEEDINTLLKGEAITGEGCAPVGGAEEGGSGKNIPEDKQKLMVDKFTEACNGLLKDEEVKTAALQLQRAFFVLQI